MTDGTVLDKESGTGLGVLGAEIEPPQTDMGDGAGAHGAGLERHIEGQVGEVVVFEPGGRVAQGDDLGVGGRVVGADRAVGAGRNYLT